MPCLLEIDSSGSVIGWSVLSGEGSRLAAVGTVAGTLGNDFDTSAYLEIFSVDVGKKTSTRIGRTSANDRFNKICWGLTTNNNATLFPKGILAGALTNGTVNIWDPVKIINQAENSLIASCEKHSAGPVQGLDFNPFQPTLLASGGSDSEIFIWDLQTPSQPTVYNPGAKTHNQQDSGITCVAWNRKVQHILASTSHSATTVVWDLKAKRAVLSFSDQNRKLRCRAMTWNPEEATQVITASEDDSYPVIQIWDLRNTYAPSRTLPGHSAGIWGLSWCPMDNDMLLSCGRDNRTLCWNIKTGEILCEVDVGSPRWNFDVQWSPKIPAILSTCSLDGKIRIYSLQDVRSEQSASPSTLGLGTSSGTTPQSTVASKPPKWLKRSIGATFGFGGKLVSFKKGKPPGEKKIVTICQIVTEKDILSRAEKLDEAIQSEQNLKNYCQEKITSSTSAEEKSLWGLLKVLMEESQRHEILQYLGYDASNINKEIAQLKAKYIKESNSEPLPQEEVSDHKDSVQPNANSDVSGLFTSAGSADNVFESLQQPSTSASATPQKQKPRIPVKFAFEGGDEELIAKALLIGNFEHAVDCCIATGRMSEALILAAYGGEDLWQRTQESYFKANANNAFTSVMKSIIKDELHELVEDVDLTHWKAALALLCTYASKHQFPTLAGVLGDRLAANGDLKSATLCYICSGNIDKTANIWATSKGTTLLDGEDNTSYLSSLQSFIEKITIFRKALKHTQTLNQVLANKFSEYAHILASQGRVKNAIHCLSFLTQAKYEDTSSFPFVLLDRLYHSLPFSASEIQSPPPFPFARQVINVATPASQPHPHPQPPISYQSATGPSPSTGRVFVPPSAGQVSHSHPALAPSPSPAIPAKSPFQPSAPHPSTHAPFSSDASRAVPRDSYPPLSIPPNPATTVAPTHVVGTSPVPLPSATPTTTVAASHPSTVPPAISPFSRPPPSSFVPLPTATATSTSASAISPPPLSTSTSNSTSMPTPVPVSISTPVSTTSTPTPAATLTPLPSVPVSRPTGAPATVPPPSSAPPSTSRDSLGPSPTPTSPSKSPAQAKSSGPTSPENQYIIDSLNSILTTCSKSTDPKVSKFVSDVRKRLEQVFDKLSKNEYSQGVTSNLTQLCQAIISGDSKSASNIHMTLTNNNWEEMGSSVMIGIKRLNEITKQ